MPFNPLLPANNSPDSSAEMRSQLTGLFDLIQTIPVGPVGPAGVTAAFVDSVTTEPPGNGASATVGLTGETLHFTFNIPRGDVGAQGITGDVGATGATGLKGDTGDVGPAFTNFAVEGVNTLPAGTAASVALSFDGVTARFTFGIPAGADGAQGIQGVPGPSDLSGTSSNSNGVALLGLAVSDPPTQAQMQALANKLDELITALRR
jgi:hypothetical protein